MSPHLPKQFKPNKAAGCCGIIFPCIFSADDRGASTLFKLRQQLIVLIRRCKPSYDASRYIDTRGRPLYRRRQISTVLPDNPITSPAIRQSNSYLDGCTWNSHLQRQNRQYFSRGNPHQISPTRFHDLPIARPSLSTACPRRCEPITCTLLTASISHTCIAFRLLTWRDRGLLQAMATLTHSSRVMPRKVTLASLASSLPAALSLSLLDAF